MPPRRSVPHQGGNRHPRLPSGVRAWQGFPPMRLSVDPARFEAKQIADAEPWLVAFTPAPAPASGSLRALLDAALDAPIAAEPLEALARGARSIVVVVSDASRDEPRREFLECLAERLPMERVRVLIATGTHAPAHTSLLPERFRSIAESHRADGSAPLVDLGTTPEGTRVRLAARAAEADLVIGTGRMRPHYFAGYSGGAKAVFPGLAHQEDALANHRWKADPTARLGRVDDNRCRLDMEAAARRLPGRFVVLNLLCDVEGAPVAAAYGDPVAAHRRLAAQAERCFAVAVPRARVIVVSDRPPIASSLYQASKCLPPAGALLEPGGTLILLAACEDGLGPKQRVNEGIFRLGIERQLPPGTRVVLVSTAAPGAVRETYAEPAASLRDALRAAGVPGRLERAPLLWRAGELVARPLA